MYYDVMGFTVINDDFLVIHDDLMVMSQKDQKVIYPAQEVDAAQIRVANISKHMRK